MSRSVRNKKPLGREFYARPPVEVARDLLGAIITHGAASARIVETEAYLGEGDGAAHSARGITPRTKLIFGPPGFAYVYFVYGLHHCLNVVAEQEGSAGCVLIRALEPIDGIDLSCQGPARLTRALGITLAQNGTDLTDGPIRIYKEDIRPKPDILISPRIGITKSADLPLRFFLKGNSFVSGRRVR
jgi:DNA-3-methyladenine glycosylase